MVVSLVEPNKAKSGISSAAAICIGPLSLVKNAEQQEIRAINSRKELFPARLITRQASFRKFFSQEGVVERLQNRQYKCWGLYKPTCYFLKSLWQPAFGRSIGCPWINPHKSIFSHFNAITRRSSFASTTSLLVDIKFWWSFRYLYS